MEQECDNAELAIREGESIQEYMRRMDAHLAHSLSNLGADPDMEHRDGIPWHDALIPPRFHRCYAHTSGWVGFDKVLRCSCGAIRNTRFHGWLEKNSRRKSEREELRRKWRGQA